MDPGELRADIPVCEDTVYLNTGASGPSPRRVVEAFEASHEHHEFSAPREEGMYEYAFDFYDEVRVDVATHLGAGASDVALTTNTTDGIGRVAAAIDWEPGDAVVRTDLEHPAGVLPWERLARTRDAEVRVVETDGAHVPMDAYKEAVEGARLVNFSSICWISGSRLDVAPLVDVAHDAGSEVVVDAVQSVGQERVDVTEWGADYVAAAGHKWLLGPWGAGFLYADPDAAVELTPAQIGYLGVEEPTAEPYELYPDARRFEIGTTNTAPHAGLQEAIATLEDVGLDTVRAHNERLTDRLKAGLDDDRLVSPRGFESGLVSFEVDDPEATVERLKGESIRIRPVPRPGTVRASLHVFNTAGDVDALLSAL
jgi:cysteine desulfurase/selenocysteine lyase